MSSRLQQRGAGRQRHRRGPWLLGLAVALAAGTVAATDIYRTEDADGNVIYTDEPPSEDAEPLDLDTINVGDPLPVRSDSNRDDDASADADAEAEETDYDGVRIVFPPAEEATRRVTGRVPVRVELEPEDATLADGHAVRVDVDGDEAGRAASTEVEVGPLSPGPHDLQAAVVDADGDTVVTSETIRFHLLRQNVND